MTTRQEAIDAMMGHVKQAVAAATTVPDPVVALWPDVPGTPPTDGSWVRPKANHNFGRQSSLSDFDGKRRFTHSGFLSIDIYAPPGDGRTQLNYIVQKIVAHFETVRDSPIWYRNIRAMDTGKDGAFESALFMADFEYDDVQ